MSHTLDTRRILIYLAFAFGIAWATSFVIYLTGGLAESPVLIPELNVSLAQALLLAPLLNSVATFGEEFGWRTYLQPKLMGLGQRRALTLTGVIWGVWHWPAIFMGYNYGFDYPGAPFLGPLAMVWFTVTLGVLLGWLTLRGKSVWLAAIGHGAINGVAGLGTIFLQGSPNTLLGPTPVGVIGGLGFAVVAAGILLYDGSRE